MSTMTPEMVISVLTLIVTVLGLAGGFYTLRQSMEHRLTAIETDIHWIKKYMPKRLSDRAEAE